MPNLGNLRLLSRLNVPRAKISRVNNATLDLIINEVARDINARLKLLRTDAKFEKTAEQYKYDLSDASDTVERFYKIDEPGIWWNSNTVAVVNYRRLFPRTVKWLDKNQEGWRNQGSGDPRYYAKQGKFLIFHPTPSITLADGFWLYYIENTIDMDSANYFPWGHTSKISEYAFLTDLIIKGVEVWLKPPVGKKQEGSAAMAEYRALADEKEAILLDSPDIRANVERTKITLRNVC